MSSVKPKRCWHAAHETVQCLGGHVKVISSERPGMRLVYRVACATLFTVHLSTHLLLWSGLRSVVQCCSDCPFHLSSSSRASGITEDQSIRADDWRAISHRSLSSSISDTTVRWTMISKLRNWYPFVEIPNQAGYDHVVSLLSIRSLKGNNAS